MGPWGQGLDEAARLPKFWTMIHGRKCSSHCSPRSRTRMQLKPVSGNGSSPYHT